MARIVWADSARERSSLTFAVDENAGLALEAFSWRESCC